MRSRQGKRITARAWMSAAWGLLLVGVAGCSFAPVDAPSVASTAPASASDPAPQEPASLHFADDATPAADASELRSFGLRETRGEVGLGLVRNTLETARASALPEGRRLEIQSDVTTLLLAAEQVRATSTRATLTEERGRVLYRGRPQPRLAIEIELVGDRVRVRTDGAVPSLAAPLLPERLPDARILDDERLSALEDLFVQRLRAVAAATTPVEAWAGWRFAAIVPSLLAVRDFEVEVVATEELAVAVGKVSTTHVRLVRLTDRPDDMARELPGSPHLVRDLWLTQAGRIVKMEIAPQGSVHQAHTIAFSHDFMPGYAGWSAVVAPDVAAAGADLVTTPAARVGGGRRHPAVLVAVGADADELWVGNRLSWQLAAQGWVVARVTVTPANFAARTREVGARLQARPDVDPERFRIVAVGGMAAVACATLPAAAGWTSCSQGLLLINGRAGGDASQTALRAAVEARPASFPVGVLWSAGGETTASGSRQVFADGFAASTGEGRASVRVQRLAGLDACLRDPLDPAWIAARAMDAIERWLSDPSMEPVAEPATEPTGAPR
ncbi:MAG: hypothetical protein AB7O52_14430 [Planctomycetota bacterium]